MSIQKVLLMSIIVLFLFAAYVTVSISGSSSQEEKAVKPVDEKTGPSSGPSQALPQTERGSQTGAPQTSSQEPAGQRTVAPQSPTPERKAPPGSAEPPRGNPPPSPQRPIPQQPGQQTPPQRPPIERRLPSGSVPPRPTPRTNMPVGGRVPIELRFDNLSLYDFITEIAQRLNINYIIASNVNVNSTVNLVTTKTIYQDQLFPIFQTVLKMNGAAAVKDGEIYHIVPLAEAPKEAIPVYKNYGLSEETIENGSPQDNSVPKETEDGKASSEKSNQTPVSQVTKDNPTSASKTDKDAKTGAQKNELATFIVPVEFLTSKEVAELIKPFVLAQAPIIDVAKANMVLITDYKSNMDRLIEIIHALDGKAFQEGNVDLIKTKYYAANDIAEDLKRVFAGTKDAPTGVNIIPIERLNSILISANSPRAMYEVQKWIDRLDAPTGRSVKTFVYHVQNSVAGNIAAVLSQLFADTGQQTGQTGTQTRPGQGQQQRQPLGAGQTQVSPFGGTFNRQQGALGQTGMSGYGAPGSGFGSFGQNTLGGTIGPRLSGSFGPSQVQLVGTQGNMRVVVDDLNNALIIQSTEADYDFLMETIKQLDVLPRQVLIDAKIVQVKLTDNMNFGITSQLLKRPTEGSAGSPEVSDFFRSTTGVPWTTAKNIAGNLDTRTFAFVANQSILLAGLSALRQKTQVKVLQSPTILALDGQQAKIQVGSDVPVTTSTYGDPRFTTPTTGGVGFGAFNSVQFRETGTTLLVNPRINASGVVTMEIAQEVSNVAPPPAGSDQSVSLTPTIEKTLVNTTLTVRDGETVVIGGIIQENRSVGRSRIPLLGDIPIVGALFGSTNRNVARNELIILITPRVIRDAETHKIVTEDSRTIHKEADRFTSEKEAEVRRLLLDAQKKKQKMEEKKEKEKQPR